MILNCQRVNLWNRVSVVITTITCTSNIEEVESELSYASHKCCRRSKHTPGNLIKSPGDPSPNSSAGNLLTQMNDISNNFWGENFKETFPHHDCQPRSSQLVTTCSDSKIPPQRSIFVALFQASLQTGLYFDFKNISFRVKEWTPCLYSSCVKRGMTDGCSTVISTVVVLNFTGSPSS